MSEGTLDTTYKEQKHQKENKKKDPWIPLISDAKGLLLWVSGIPSGNCRERRRRVSEEPFINDDAHTTDKQTCRRQKFAIVSIISVTQEEGERGVVGEVQVVRRSDTRGVEE